MQNTMQYLVQQMQTITANQAAGQILGSAALEKYVRVTVDVDPAQLL